MNDNKNTENEIANNFIDVKLEPFDEGYDCTQNIDPLEPDDNKIECLADGSDLATNKLISTDIRKTDLCDIAIKTEEINIKNEYLDNEVDGIQESCGITEKDSSLQNQTKGQNHSYTVKETVEGDEQTDKKNNIKYGQNPTFGSNCLLIINVNASNENLFVNHSNVKHITNDKEIETRRIHKQNSTEIEGSPNPVNPGSVQIEHDCPICYKKFPSLSKLIRHNRIHTGKKLYGCDICKKSFYYPSALTLHMRVHTGEKPYVCDICNKSYSQSFSLAEHKNLHTGHKPYACDICNKSFSHSCSLTIHKRVHIGEKPFACDICEKSFINSSSLTMHKRIHTGEKPYSCDVCKKCFSQFSSLVKHKRIHTGEKPYACDICKKSFSHSLILTNHKRIHTGEKPYICDICNKSFSRSTSLTAHKRIHTGEKPYTCDFCKKSFRDSNSLIRHKRIHLK